MRQIEITGPRQYKIDKVSNPSAYKNWVVVKIISAPMCTEYKQYESGVVNHPLGHEAAGEVVEVADSDLLKVGDRVVVMPQYPCGKCLQCRSGEYIHCEDLVNLNRFTGNAFGDSTYAEYIIKPDWLLPKIPDGISYNHASMLCCGLGPAFGAMDRMNVSAYDTVLITGLGPVGLGAVINAKYRNSKVLAVTKNPYRKKLAEELGADKIIDQNDPELVEKIKNYTNSLGVDVSLDCAGSPDAQRLLIDSSKRNGKIAFVGESGELKTHISNDLIRKGLTLYGIWHYNYKGIQKLFRLVADSPDQMDKLITHQFALEEVGDAWELQLKRECGKVILHP